MKKQLLALLLFIGLAFTAKAQYVTIPDSNFVVWLTARYPQCMSGNQMDTTCSAVLTDTLIYCDSKNISSLEGVQYFKSLRSLVCSNNQLIQLPPLPPSLTNLSCFYNQLTSLPPLPISMIYLYCGGNQLSSLPALPATLTYLDFSENRFTSLPPFPVSLKNLNFESNFISGPLPAMPATLKTLGCSYNYSITSLPSLPDSLTVLWCNFTHLTSLPNLPPTLTQLECISTNLTVLPTLPASLKILSCSYNNLTSLPPLPATLVLLQCRVNNLTVLPALPASLIMLDCSNNMLTSLPALLADSLSQLICNSNLQLTCLPKLPTKIYYFDFDSTSITCLPNYPWVNFSSPALATLPLCDLFNSNACEAYWNISGKAFEDANSNCAMDSNETGVSNIKCQLWSNGALVQQAYLQGSYVYSFDTYNYGNYEVTLDTANQPFVVTCPVNNIYYDTITATDSMIYNNDFAVQCKPGFDVRVYSISSYYRFRPANNSTVWINAGDASNFYNAHCAAGVAGVVTVVINGPAHYSGPANGALSPTTVNGDTVTWNVADFGIVNALTDFNVVVQTDTLAPIGSQICITVNVTPTAGDNNPANNTLTHCFNVVSSYDPNEKEVYPSGNIDTAQDWLTYTVHFQNTGTAEAQHIYVKDTLDANVDEGSFQLLAYSHQPVIQINEKIVRFNFPNINLPDSTTDEPNSHGYVQYKVKLKQHLPIGTQISNTAYIYFDFNSPVVTNTVTNTVAVDTSVTIGIPTIKKDAQLAVTIYPNPANTQLTVAVGAPNGTIHIYSTEGKLLNTYTMQGTAQTINIETLASGIYYIEVSAQGQTARKKLVKL